MSAVKIQKRDSADPLEVIDIMGKADSNSGMAVFLSECKDGDTIINPYVYPNTKIRLETDVVVRDTLTIQSVAPFRAWPQFVKTVSLPWRVTGGTCATWQYDERGGEAMIPYSFQNPYGVHAESGNWEPNAHGAENGGFSGSTGASGVDYDGLHLTDRYRAPFTPAMVGKKLLYVVSPSLTCLRTIKSVSADGRTVYFAESASTALHENSTHTVAWAIVEQDAPWYAEFLPNPAYQRTPFVNGWMGYKDCLDKVQNRNQSPIFRLEGDARLIGLELVGPNLGWRNPPYKYDASEPAGVEYQRAVESDSPDAQVIGCKIRNTWGAGEYGPAQMVANEIHDVGMQHGTIAFDHKQVHFNTLYRSHHSSYSIENADVDDVAVDDNIFGAPHGVSVSSTIQGFEFARNRSTLADVKAGRIPAITDLQAGTWGDQDHKKSSGWRIYDNEEDYAAPKDPAWSIHDVDGAEVTNNRASTTSYFLSAKGCTNVKTNPPNNGGPTCKGQVAP